MIRNHLAITFRNLLRNKLYSFIHILGLSIGISAALVIFLIVRYEFGFDTFEKDSDRIFRVVMDTHFNGMEGHSAAVPAPLSEAMRDEVSGLEATVPVMKFQGDATVTVQVMRDNKPVIFKQQPDVVFTNDEYFELIPFTWIIGSPEVSLKEPFSVVLTETRARQYFANMPVADIIGKQLVYNHDLQFTVTGIVHDIEESTDFTAREFLAHATIAKTSLQQNFMMTVWNDWMAYSQVYVKLKNANRTVSVEKQLRTLLDKYHKDANKDAANNMAFRLQPLRDIHFNSLYAGFGQRLAHEPTLYGLLAIAGFLLLLGCINFTNLATASASHRAKEIGIRKTIGSTRGQLVRQFLVETLVITCIATLLSIYLAPLLLELFSDFIPAGITFQPWREPVILLFLFLLILVVSFLAGFYPAVVLSAFKPAAVLKNNAFAGMSTRSGAIRKALTVSQFVIAQFFIIAAFMVSKQIHFVLHQDLGYRKDAILNFTIPRDTVADHREGLLNSIVSLPEVQQATIGFLPPATEGAAFTNIRYSDGKSEIKTAGVQIRWGTAAYISLYKINLVAGRNVHEGKNVHELLINETYAKELGFKNAEEAIGKELTMGRDDKFPIVGVMQNFHETSFRGAIGPLVFKSDNSGGFFHVALMPQATNGTSWSDAISKIEKAFHAIYPDAEFKYNFYDDAIAQFYTREQQTASLLNWSMGLSVLISCMGMLGLVVYTTTARTKEIGIRKIMGASVSSIVSILSIEFVLLVVIAFAIAAPLAWWGVDQWLNNFAYRTTMSWWVFAASGLLLLLVAFITLSTQIIRTAMLNPVQSLRTE
jgi:ABC-type antimicrobial peptide transport system permease subunit